LEDHLAAPTDAGPAEVIFPTLIQIVVDATGCFVESFDDMHEVENRCEVAEMPLTEPPSIPSGMR
jgi:hypothetical protein